MSRVTVSQLLDQARSRIVRLSPEEAQGAMGSGAVLIDIRGESQQRRDGIVPGALSIARNVLEWRLDPDSDCRHPAAPGLEDLVILMCDEGYQSSLAADTLRLLGFKRATDLAGGFQAWRAAGMAVAAA